MFAVIYSFKVKEGQDEDFKKSWKGLTELIYQYENSLGSRLHKGEGQEYIAYATWPDHKTWDLSGDKLPPEADQWRTLMRETCTEIKTLHKLEMVDDLLKDGTYGVGD